MHRNTLRRFTQTIRSHSSSVRSAVPVIACSEPALLKAKSRRPSASTPLSRAALTSWARVTSHLTARRPPAEFLDHAGRFRVALFRNIGNHHTGALASERQRCGTSDAVPCSGHERNLSCEASIVVRRSHYLLLSALFLHFSVRYPASPWGGLIFRVG